MIVRFISGIVFLIVVFIAAAFLFGWYVKDRALPRYEGEAQASGLKHPVNIYRDSFAVAHIEAATDEDAYYGLGYVHAQERMFQMDFVRRLGKGRLAEVLGEKALILDKWSRTIGFARIAEEMWKSASADTKKFMLSYSRGVNAFLASNGNKLGFEFDALHYTPDEWKPTDCMIIGRLLSWEMNFSYWNDAAFGDISLAVSRERLHEIMPGYDGPTVLEGNVPPRPIVHFTPPVDTLHDTSAVKKDSLAGAFFRSQKSIMKALADIGGIYGMGGGSNAIAISPHHSATGGALLENDLHLAVGAPSRFYLAHLRSQEGLNVSGITVPGLPVILAGRNEKLAWGITNGMIDECDYFILKSKEGEYETPSGTKYFSTIAENIAVRGLTPEGGFTYVPLQIRISDFGPVMSDISTFEMAKVFMSSPNKPVAPKANTVLGKNTVVTLMWNGFRTTGDEVGTFFRLHHAASALDLSPTNEFATPCLSLCLADKAGNISYHLMGRVPHRLGNEESILLPRKAENAQDSWQEPITSASLPSLFNPSEGFIVSANNPSTINRTVPHSNNWEPPARAERVRQLLKTYSKVDVNRLRQIITDVSSPFEKLVLVPNILRVMRGKGDSVKYDRLTEEALEYLENWDGRQSEIDVSTTILNVFFARLMTDALSDELGEDLLGEFDYINNVPARTMMRLLRDEDNILWDDIRSPQRENRDTIIKYAFKESIVKLKAMLGADSRKWNWGRVHSLTYRHPFSAFSSQVAKLGDIRSGYAPGGLTTVTQSSYSFWKPFEPRVGPAMREISDMKTDVFSVVLPTGNSGNMFSPHYGDMAQMFKQGELYSFSLKERGASWKLFKLIPAK
jgi:penicillin amidase